MVGHPEFGWHRLRGDIDPPCSHSVCGRVLRYPGSGATGMLVRDYAARAPSRRSEVRRDPRSGDLRHPGAGSNGGGAVDQEAPTEVGISEVTRRLNARRDRCAAASGRGTRGEMPQLGQTLSLEEHSPGTRAHVRRRAGTYPRISTGPVPSPEPVTPPRHKPTLLPQRDRCCRCVEEKPA